MRDKEKYFKSLYNKLDGDNKIYYLKLLLKTEELYDEKQKNIKSKNQFRVLFKKGCIVICFVSVIFTLSTGLKIFANIDIFDSIIKFTKEFISEEVKLKVEPIGDLVIYENIKDLEKDFNIDIPKIKRIPQGYILRDINVYKVNNNNWSKLFIYYLNGNEQIIYSMNNLYSSQKITIEKDETLIEEYQLNGFTVYITENNNWRTATWSNQNMKYEIYGKLSVEILKDMVNSIYN